jgi:type I restriction enzyme S subunit
MKGQFFSNTDIQPSILFFENTGKPTSVIEFWEVEKNSVGVITETLVVSVPREKIDTDSYSLDMRRYVEVAISEKASSFPMVKLGDIMKSVKGARYNVSDGTDTGKYPLIRSSKDGSVKWMDTYTHEGPLIAVGNGGTANFHYAEKFNASTHTLVYDCNDTANKKYVYYMLNYNSDRINESCFKGTGLKNLKLEDFNDFAIPLPPLDTQKQVVERLDGIYDNAHTASHMTKIIQTQMLNIMNSVEMRGYRNSKLIDVCTHSNGKTLSKNDKDNGGDFNVMGGGMDYIGNYSLYNRDGDNITISKSGASAGFVKFHTEKFWAGDCFTITPTNETLNIRFLYYYLKLNPTLTSSHTTGTTIPHCKWDDINEISIPVPPLEIQQQIITILNRMETECKCLGQMTTMANERANFLLGGYMS